MVQDQLDPEYYEAYDSQGRSKHFGDHSYCLTEDRDHAQESKTDSGLYQMGGYSDCLAERVPLVVVPIPYASDWLFRGIKNTNGSGVEARAPTSAIVSPVSAVKGERKRGFDDVDDEDETMSDDPNPSSSEGANVEATSQPTRQKTSGAETAEPKDEETGGDTTDWWPAGTCGTSSDECPVLAKLCYDELWSEGTSKSEEEQSSSRPLMLNDVVSFVGVLSMNPWDADFSGQQSSSPTSDGMMDCMGWDSMMATTETIPPPSRLPRIHVLSYQKLHLDDLALRAIDVEKGNYNKRNEEDELMPEREGVVCDGSPGSTNNDSDSDEESVEWSGFPSKPKSVSMGVSSLMHGGPFGNLPSMEAEPWIRSLWLCLLSEAERRISEFDSDRDLPKIIRAGPAERALGCISLQLSTPDVASARSLYCDLAENVLPDVCPVVATVDLAETATDNSSFTPRKDHNGRLKPCPLQLPKGSVLLVHYPSPRISSCANNATQNNGSKGSSRVQTSNNLESSKSILHELVRHHKIPYRFEGGVTIPFEADYRVIVVTTQTQDLPCTLSALTRTSSITPAPLVASPTKKRECPTKPELRETLAKGRSLKNRNDALKFSSPLLERAQNDFLERRRKCHASSPSSPLPGEDDFHRWLTMTRLQTKSRFSRDESSNKKDGGHKTRYFEPLAEDWEAALKLDDDLRCV